ncbi:MAG: hypothetical protein AB8B97_01910 [Granulosicoccus sp.]
MDVWKNKLVAGLLLSLPLVSSCTSIPEVGATERDTTGAYRGVWVGLVDKPRASTEILPGNWRMRCDWEPFEIYLSVDNGSVTLGDQENVAYISDKGQFRIEFLSGPATMVGGSMPGAPENIQVFSGQLAGDNPDGKYVQRIATFGSGGCSAGISFSRYEGSNV